MKKSPRPAPRERQLPDALAWLFPEVDAASVRVRRDARFVLARVLERGRMVDVVWCVRTYGLEGVGDFFHGPPHPEVSPRTERIWRLVLGEKDVSWPRDPASPRANAELWLD